MLNLILREYRLYIGGIGLWTIVRTYFWIELSKG